MPEPLVEILMVEGNPDDAELTLLALRDHKVSIGYCLTNRR